MAIEISQSFDAAQKAITEIGESHYISPWVRRQLIEQLAEIIREELRKLDEEAPI